AGHGRRRTVRALVTGATGFTGGHLARTLAARGDTVSALVRAEGPAATALKQAGVALSVADLRGPAALAKAAGGVGVGDPHAARGKREQKQASRSRLPGRPASTGPAIVGCCDCFAASRESAG